jgi:hypothetical protein
MYCYFYDFICIFENKIIKAEAYQHCDLLFSKGLNPYATPAHINVA